MIKISSIKLNPKNPRKIDKEILERLCKSLKKFPKMIEKRPIVIDENKMVLGGNQRLKALKKLGYKEIPENWVADASDWTEEEKKEFIIKDNISYGSWNEDILKDWDVFDLKEWDLDLDFEMDFGGDEGGEYKQGVSGSLRKLFLAPPFSILDAKQGDWQKRKKQWISLGIKSEIGRDNFYNSLGNLQEKKEGKKDKWSSTSIFDPALCEIVYNWFSKKDDFVIDPFAGGSVRGIIASKTERNYLGIELSENQVKANIKQADDICEEYKPTWKIGDSNKILDSIEDDKFNMCISCPPYINLEVYSDLKEDLSNMNYEDFLKVYRSIINKTYKKLKDNSFCVWVIGEVRDKKGNYHNFLGETIKAFLDAGFNYYNEIILSTMIGTSMLRAKKHFLGGRKVCKIHQNVLVFVKGDGKKASKRLGDVEIKTNFENEEEDWEIEQ